MFKNFVTDWSKRDRSKVFNTLFVAFEWILTTFALFYSDEEMPCVRRYWKIILRGLPMDFWCNLGMGILIITSLWALLETNLLIMFLISSIEKSTAESDLYVTKGKIDGNVLLLLIYEHCFAKKDLKISLFSLKSAINLLSWKNGGINWIFLAFKTVCNRVQQHLGLVDGWDSFVEISL